AVRARRRQVEGPRAAGAPARVLHALPRTLGRRRARRSGRPDRARGQAHPAALRWAAAPARRGHRHRRQPGTAVPRRTHGRVRPASPPRLPRPGAPARRRGHHRPAHHARPGRSREAGRPHPDPGRRAHRRQRLRRAALPADRRRLRDQVDHRRAAVRALRGGRDRFRPRTPRPARGSRHGPRSPPGDLGGHLPGAGARARIRARRGGRAAFRERGGEPVNANAMRAGLRRGWIEFCHTWSNRQDLLSYLLPTAVLLSVLFFQRDSEINGIPLGTTSVPGVLGMTVAFGGLISMGQLMVAEREDGTLLRAKAVPHGMAGYLVGKIVTVSGMTLASMAILLIPSLVMFDGFDLGAGSWPVLLGITLLGLAATVPIGAVFGSLFDTPSSMGLIMIPMTGLIVISGIFFPITVLPEWLQGVAQVFPVYWLGLGMRSALLPDAMAAAAIGGSWRHLETVGVLGLWAVVGFVVAPVVLRRMARRESGASV